MSQPIMLPIPSPHLGFWVWLIEDIYTGLPGSTGQYVPRKDDLVLNWASPTPIMRVVKSDFTTGLSELKAVEILPTSNELTDLNRLVGAGPGHISESYKLRIDTSKIPFVMAFDDRLLARGGKARFVKVFRGTEPGKQKVVSRHYAANGTLIGENIPLEPILDEHNNPHPQFSAPVVSNCSESMDDGELVTAMFYDDEGGPLFSAVLTVFNTNWIRKLTTAKRRITRIELDSPFVSLSNPKIVEVPINIPLSQVAKRLVVHYSDGGRRVVTIDGSKSRLLGIKGFVPTELGKVTDMTLIYFLGEDEQYEGMIDGDIKHILENYELHVVRAEGAYSVKLFSYPVWVDPIAGYRLEHFLYNLDRQRAYRVTDKVTIAENSPVFEPLLFGVAQDLTLAVNLNEVDPLFANYTHVQMYRVSLLRTGTDHGVRWTVNFDRNQPSFGEQVEARLQFNNGTLWNLRIDNDLPSLEVWLQETYLKTYPIVDPGSESAPIEPTHIRVIIGNITFEASVVTWNETFTVESPQLDGRNVYVQFIRKTNDTDLELATAALPVRNVT